MGMKKIYKIFILGCLALMASEVKAQDKKRSLQSCELCSHFANHSS